jgi:NNP family nitrate/nitrite transporter-like MFS transporter
MRAFHYAWFGFFIGKFVWFAISPIRPLIASDLNLSDDDIRVAQTVGFVAKALARIVSGPLCDAYGARITFSVMLCVGSIPAALIGTVQSLAGFCAVKVTVAILTGTLVSSLFWSSQMFTKEIVGTANGLVGGWADLGMTQLSMLF